MNGKLLFAVVFIFSIIAGLVAGEIYLRWLDGKKIIDTKCRASNGQLHHILVPNSSCRLISDEYNVSYKINSFGMRDREYSLEKPKDTFRILMLGDSFTEGGGVELKDSFVKLVEEKLKQDTRKNIEIMNAGVGSYSPALEYVYLKEKGLKFNPDLVVINYDQTDFSDDITNENWFLERYPEARVENLNLDEELSFLADPIKAAYNSIDWVPDPKILENFKKNPALFLPLIPKSFQQQLVNHSLLWRQIVRSVLSFMGKESLYYNLIKGDYLLFQITPGYLPADLLIHTRNIDLPHYQEWFSITERNILLINRLLKHNDIPFLLTVYPHGHQVNGEEWGEGRKVHLFEKGQVYSTRIFDSLEKLGKEKNIPVLSLLDDFRKTTDKPLFYSKDGHFTTKGHQVMAKGLENYLINSGLIR